MESVEHTLTKGPPQRVSRVQFGLLRAETIEALSVAEITGAVIYSRGAPAPGGCMDPRLGTTDRRASCATCGNDVRTCAGHIGHINLPLACFNVGYLEHTRKVLQCCCQGCLKICWDPADERVTSLIAGSTVGKARLSAVYKICRARKVCARCQAPRGIVDRTGLAYTVKFPPGVLDALEPDEAAFYQQPLYPDLVRSIFEFIPEEEQRHLGFKPQYARPVDMIITKLVVPPAIIRPAISASEGSRARGMDDLTIKLQEINKRCIEMRSRMRNEGWDKHNIPLAAVDAYARLQYEVATLVVSNIPRMRPSTMRSGIPLRSLTDRLKGKRGRVRAHLMGKRVDFSARSVISPDPTIDVDEVGVPLAMALVLTYSERVTKHNIEILRDRVRVGPGKLAGAESVKLRDGKSIQLAYVADPSTIEVVPGCVVERYLQDGDYVLFNRQPSLHKMSMMAHRVKVVGGDTLRLNLSCTTPYNADFDGDEMNLHVMQSLAAVAEAREIMAVPKQIVAPQSNKPCMGLVQDTLLGTYLLTSPDVFLDSGDVMQILMQLKYPANSDLFALMPPPTVLKPRRLWTGAQMFSLLFPDNLYMGSPAASKLPDLGSTTVCIQAGEIVHGRLKKQHVGTSAGGVVHTLYLDCGDDVAARFLSEAQRLVNYWQMTAGSSIGIWDCVCPPEARKEVDEYVAMATWHVDQITRAAEETGTLNTEPVEDAIQDILTKVLGAAGGIVTKHMPQTTLMQAVAAGSKGNPVNISQISGAVGQQCVDGGRIHPPAPARRTLPVYATTDKSAESRGFVPESYDKGLNPCSYFFHAQGGREGLVDTAVKTARTGYIQRRLIKGMESEVADSNGSIRDAAGSIVQFVYGSDGWDATWLEKQGCAALDLSDAELARRSSDGELDAMLDARDRVRDAMLAGPIGTLVGHVYVPVAAGRLIKQCRDRDGLEHDAIPDDLRADGFADRVWHECQQLCCSPLGAASLELVIRYEWRAAAVRELSLGQRAWLRDEAVRRTARARVSQGEMVGCIAAQSIGEPTTQVTPPCFGRLTRVCCRCHWKRRRPCWSRSAGSRRACQLVT